MKKKYFSYLMTFAMIVSMSLSMLPSFSPEILTVYAAEVFDIEEKEGTIQGNITYKLDSSGVLHIYNPNETTLPTTNDGLEEYLAAAQKEEPATEKITPPGITDDDPVVDFPTEDTTGEDTEESTDNNTTEDTTDNSTTESTVIDNKTEETKQGDNTTEIQTPTLVVKEEEITEAPATTDGSYKSEIIIATQTTGKIGEAIKRNLTLSKVTGIKGVNKKGKRAYITWKSVTNADKYELQIATKKNMKKNMKSAITTKTKLTTSKLNKGTYYFRVRAVNGDVKGSWSKVIKVKVKK